MSVSAAWVLRELTQARGAQHGRPGAHPPVGTPGRPGHQPDRWRRRPDPA